MQDENESRQLRVCMVGLRGIAADGLGGVEKAVRELSTRLVAQGVDVTCYCRARYNDLTEYQGVRLVNAPTYYSKHLETGLYAMGALWEASAQGYDIIHIHALASAFFAWMPRWRGRSKVVWTIHGLDWQRAKWGGVASRLLRCGQAIGLHNADRVICVSKSLTTYFQMAYPQRRFDYIPNGCDNVAPDLAQAAPPEGLSRRGYLLFMGRLVPEKGLHRLIEAYRRLATPLPLVIAGSDLHAEGYGRELRRLAAGDGRIRFVGTVTGSAKERLLQNAQLFVLTSELEGLPVALLEAASRGVPVFVSAIPTNLEVVDGASAPPGFLCDPYSVASIAANLKVALADERTLMAWGLALQRHVLAAYNWDAIARQTLLLYEELVRG